MAQFSRRSLIKAAALPALGTFALPSLAAAIETSSAPQQRPKLKITDVRTAQVKVHGPQTHIRIYTDQGIYRAGRIDRCRGRNCFAGARAGAACWSGRIP